MRALILVASLALASGHAAAFPEWLKFEPRERTERTLESTQQYQQLVDALPAIFAADHLGSPYPDVFIVEPNAEVLRTYAPGILNRHTTVNAIRYRFRDRAIYVSELALMENPQDVIRRVEHAVAHLHVHSHYGDTANWHGDVFDHFCERSGFSDSCKRIYCSHPRSETWSYDHYKPDRPD